MRLSKVVGLKDGDELPSSWAGSAGRGAAPLIQIGQAEAFALAASLDEMEMGPPDDLISS